MTNILIPTDFSENSWNSIVYTLSFFKNAKCTFYLLHVIKPARGNASNIIICYDGDQQKNSAHSRAKVKLQQLINEIELLDQEKNHRFFPIICSGNIVESIRTQVNEKKIDIIVLGTRGASELTTTSVGSNTADVINKVKCTALVIPEKATFRGIEKMALPTDFNIFYSAKILDTISSVLYRTHSSLEVLHLTKKEEKLIGEQLQNREFLEDYFHQDSHNFHSVTNKNLEEAIQQFIEDNEIDLVAMVAKNIHFFQQLFFNDSRDKNTNYHKNTPFLVLHD